MAKQKTGEQSKQKPSFLPTEIKGLIVVLFTGILLLSIISFEEGYPKQNWLGLLGYCIAWISLYLFGLGSYAIAAFAFWSGWRLLCHRKIEYYWIQTSYFAILLISLCFLLTLCVETFPSIGRFLEPWIYTERVQWFDAILFEKMRYNAGGVPCYYLFLDLPIVNLYHLLSPTGTAIVFATLALVSFFLLFKIPVNPTEFAHISTSLGNKLKGLWAHLQEMFSKPKEPPLSKPIHPPVSMPIPNIPTKTIPSPRTQITPKIDPVPIIKRNLQNYRIPSVNLLSKTPPANVGNLKQELHDKGILLVATLKNFGIDAKVNAIHCGPTVTSFELQPAVGVKVQKIKALENDIALNLEAQAIRIIAPIPGKAAVGIEVPNANPQTVGFRELLQSYQKGNPHHIPLLLGKTVTGELISCDLTKMPHCIIAGATGSGKSVCINTMIISILMNLSPNEVRFLMIDPKKVELTPYSNLPHMLAPVITESQDACAALKWLVREMEVRYEIFKRVGVRNIQSFNQRKIQPDKESQLGMPIPEHLPYIVGVIDELADLMMVASSDIETPIARIAQMARAVGIHLILATQRPSREVITGLIKANFPTRIAFKVASRVNSQIILDEIGAESLLGNGDMLFLLPGNIGLIRAQGAYINDTDINAVIEAICQQSPPQYMIQKFAEASDNKSSDFPGFDNNEDSLMIDARKLVIETGNASTTFLQRKLKVGYARAASLMDALEGQGIVSPQEGSKARRVLINEDNRKEEE